jgi:methylenetetrahydrofolate reductase (NADPH)
MIVSLEAVPRSAESLVDAAETAALSGRIGLINIPDLLRFPLRSWEACGILRRRAAEAGRPDTPPLELMPHIRAIDFDAALPFPHIELFRRQGIRKALVIAGDPPKEQKNSITAAGGKARRVYPTGTVEFIKKLNHEMPELELYAAFDPYRSNIRYELDYLKAKEDAGASGFMSQPFFDLRLLEIYAEYLEGKNIFWGISPVLSISSRGYWESRNRAVFPRSFRPDLAWNLEFGRRVLDFCEAGGFSLYLMPIKIDLGPYLEGLFSQAGARRV